MPKNYCIMQIRAESGKSALPICNYSQILYQFLTFTQNLKRSLIIDEWLLLKPTASEQHDILELLHRRRKKSSTIFCSQYDCNGWYDQLGGNDSPLAEAILDRIKHDTYKINIIPTDPTNYRSMREVYGLNPALSE